MVTLELPRAVLLLSRFAGPEDRPNLCTVRLEPEKDGGITAVATNGHRLISLRFAGELDEPVGLCADRVRRCLPVIGKRVSCAELRIADADDRRELAWTDGASFSVDVRHDAPNTFPQWRQLLPETGNRNAEAVPRVLGFTLSYLADLERYLLDIGEGRPAVEITHFPRDKGDIVRFGVTASHYDITYLVMPNRTGRHFEVIG